MRNRKGEIATLLTLSLVIVGAVMTVASSYFTNKQKSLTSNPKASTVNCVFLNSTECNLAKKSGDCPQWNFGSCIVCKNGKYRCPGTLDDSVSPSSQASTSPTKTSTSTKTPTSLSFICSNGGEPILANNISCETLCRNNNMTYVPNSQGQGSDGKHYCCCKKTEAGQEYDTCYKAYKPGLYGCQAPLSKIVIYAQSMSAVGMTDCTKYNTNTNTSLYFAGKPGQYEDGACARVWDGNMSLSEKQKQAKELMISSTPTPKPELTTSPIETPPRDGCINMTSTHLCGEYCGLEDKTGYICVEGNQREAKWCCPSTPPPETPLANQGGQDFGYENKPCAVIKIEGKPDFYFCFNNLICTNQNETGICVKSVIYANSPTPMSNNALFERLIGTIYLINKREGNINNVRALVKSDTSIFNNSVDLGNFNKEEIKAFEYACNRSFRNLISVDVSYNYNGSNYIQTISNSCGYNNIIILN